jgi:hypothetical protein
MDYYFVAKSETGGFMGQFTLEQIVELFDNERIDGNYVVANSGEGSYQDALKNEYLKWVKVSDFVSKEPRKEHREIPGYITFLRVFAGINFFTAALASCGFLFFIFREFSRASYEPSFALGWIIALSVAIEGFLAYGLLNAVADIAKNMIDVGAYVRHLSAAKRHSLMTHDDLPNKDS